MLRAVSIPPVAGSLTTLGRPQIIATRCAIPNALEQGAAGGRTDLRIENRIFHVTGGQAVSQLQVGFFGYYVKSDGTGEHVIGNNFNYEAAIELNSPATYNELSFRNSNVVTIEGATYGLPLILSDYPLGFDLPADTSFWLRSAVSIATNPLFMPNHTDKFGANDTGWASPSIVSQVPGTGAMTNPAGGASFGISPAMILGVPAAPMAAACILGDSIANGSNDVVSSVTGAFGFIARGLIGVNGHAVPWIKNTVGSDKLAQNTLATGPRKRSTWSYVTHLVCELGTNDIAAGTSLATCQANAQAIWQAAKRVIGPYGKPLQVAQTLIMPRTTSTDLWATVANQTPVAGFEVGTGVRDLFNAWVKTQVGGGLLDAYINPNQYVESSAGSGAWVVNGSANYPTTDGIHPSSALHILAAQAVNAWALTIAP